MAAMTWQQEPEVAGEVTFRVRKYKGMDAGMKLTFIFYFLSSSGLQHMEWCNPHLG